MVTIQQHSVSLVCEPDRFFNMKLHLLFLLVVCAVVISGEPVRRAKGKGSPEGGDSGSGGSATITKTDFIVDDFKFRPPIEYGSCLKVSTKQHFLERFLQAHVPIYRNSSISRLTLDDKVYGPCFKQFSFVRKFLNLSYQFHLFPCKKITGV